MNVHILLYHEIPVKSKFLTQGEIFRIQCSKVKLLWSA